MFIIFGTNTLKSSTSHDTLSHTCPGCGGDLELREFKTWFTLFWIPIFPFSTKGRFYTCSTCDTTFAEKDRQALINTKHDKHSRKEEGEKLYACTLTACFVNLAIANGRGAFHTDNEIDNIKAMFPNWKSEIDETILLILSSKQPDHEVHQLLRACTNVLPKNSIWELLKICADHLRCKDCATQLHINLLGDYLLVAGFTKDKLAELLPEHTFSPQTI